MSPIWFAVWAAEKSLKEWEESKRAGLKPRELEATIADLLARAMILNATRDGGQFTRSHTTLVQDGAIWEVTLTKKQIPPQKPCPSYPPESTNS